MASFLSMALGWAAGTFLLPCVQWAWATHRGFIFVEHLVVAAERDAEDDSRDVLKAVDPLLAFRPLAPDVKQPAGKKGTVVGGRGRGNGEAWQ